MGVSLTTFREFDRKGSPLTTDDNGVHGPFFTNPPIRRLTSIHKKHLVDRFAAAVNYATVVDGYLCISRQACSASLLEVVINDSNDGCGE